MSVDPAKGAMAGKQMGSGFRARKNAESPASGVRSAGAARGAFESEAGLTKVGTPDPSLLALARGETRRKPESQRLVWFLFGVIFGGGAVWAVTSDVSAEVYRARVWTAQTLRAVRAHATGGAHAEVPAAATAATTAIPTVDVSELPRAKEEAPQKGSVAAPVVAPTAPGAPALKSAPGPR
jgi:hypothetical protein